MIALDTNILVYAHRRDAEWHGQARAAVRSLAEGRARWALPWQSVHEFFGIVTHPRIYAPPSTPDQATDQLDAWMASPSVEIIGEETGYWPLLRRQLLGGMISGPRVHDARMTSVCLFHGVTELWTADRDFSRFPALVTKNPLQDP